MSDVTIRHVIVHELIKEAKKPINPSKKFKFRDTVLDPNDDIVLKLVSEINVLYGKKGNSAYYGVFKEDETERGPIPDAIGDYSTINKSSTQQFIDLSVKIMQKLALEADKQIWSSGGIIVFADYVRESNHFFLVTMIKQKEGIRLSSKLEPELLEQLDLTKINQAARINFQKFIQYQNSSAIDKNDLSYLSFISTTTQQTASGYFILALGCDKGITSTKATKSLPREAKNFFDSHPELKEHSRNFKNEIINYLEQQSKNNKPAKLSDVSTMAYKYMLHIDESIRDTISEELVQYLNGESIGIPAEFNVSTSGLNQILNVKFKGEGFSYNFEKALLGTNGDADVCYNKEMNSLTFTRLPKEAIQSIERALKEKQDNDNGDDD